MISFIVKMLLLLPPCFSYQIANAGQDFSMLSLACSRRRNVTIAMDFRLEKVKDSVKDLILAALSTELIANADCYIVNLYLNEEDRVVRLRRTDDLLNMVERTGNAFREDRFLKLVDRLQRERTIAKESKEKQTFVLIFAHISSMGANQFLDFIKPLEEHKDWDVIVYRPVEYATPIEWLPFHRYFEFAYYSKPVSKNIPSLIDVIKNPLFDRFEYEYRYLMSSTDYALEGCLDEVNTIHFLIKKGVRFYLPTVRAILHKENMRRQNTNQAPLKVTLNFFHNWYIGHEIVYKEESRSEKNIKIIRDWDEHHYYTKETRTNQDTENIYIHILDETLHRWYCDKFLVKSQNYRYRDSHAEGKEACYNDIKTFETGKDLIRFMGQDMCSKK